MFMRIFFNCLNPIRSKCRHHHCRQRTRIGEREFKKYFRIRYLHAIDALTVNSEHVYNSIFSTLILDSMPFLHERCQSNDFQFNVILCPFLLITSELVHCCSSFNFFFNFPQFTVHTTGNLMLFRYLNILLFLSFKIVIYL